MIALMSCQKLCPNFLDHYDWPIKSSYLPDLNAFLYNKLFKNSKKVVE